MIRNKNENGKNQIDDPENLADPSRIFISVIEDRERFDYARRYFESISDNSSITRAKLLRANNTGLR